MPTPGRPLEGIRVADLTMIWAGPYATKILADQGAEVIKIESPSAWDNVRTLYPPPIAPGEEWWNTNFYFQEFNRNKKSLSLDLSTVAGKDVFAQLLQHCDVVIENYRADVMGKLGLDYEWLRSQREDLIVVGMAGFGKTGPERDAMGFGLIIEMMSGLASMTGYGDDGGVPAKSGVSYGDPMGGIAAAAAVATALIHRARTGRGQYIDLAQREVMTTLLGEAFMDWSMNERLPQHVGNGDASMAPHGVYRCHGDDEWIAITARDDRDWAGLVRVLGAPEWASSPDFATQALRWEHRHDLDRRIEAWTVMQDKHEVFDRCRTEGVPAAPVQKCLELLDDPHLRARGFYEPNTQREAGTWMIHGWLWRTDGAGSCVVTPGPEFGQHNVEVLGGLLGMSDDDIGALESSGVIARQPKGLLPTSQLPR